MVQWWGEKLVEVQSCNLDRDMPQHQRHIGVCVPVGLYAHLRLCFYDPRTPLVR